MNDRPVIKASLSKVPEMIDQHHFKLQVNSSIQESEIIKIKPDLVTWIRKELQNTNIELITEITVQEQEQRPYSEREKFKEMMKKNPNVGLLSQKFNLDFGE